MRRTIAQAVPLALILSCGPAATAATADERVRSSSSRVLAAAESDARLSTRPSLTRTSTRQAPSVASRVLRERERGRRFDRHGPRDHHHRHDRHDRGDRHERGDVNVIVLGPGAHVDTLIIEDGDHRRHRRGHDHGHGHGGVHGGFGLHAGLGHGAHAHRARPGHQRNRLVRGHHGRLVLERGDPVHVRVRAGGRVELHDRR